MTESLTPPHLQAVWPNANWSNEALWHLEVPIQQIPVQALAWILDHPIWSTRPPEPRFDLRPREVMAGASAYRAHKRRIERANLSLPLIVHAHRGRRVVLDGLHRLARAVQERNATLPAKEVTLEQLRTSASA